MSPNPIAFDKYDAMGAYHWVECERHSPRYNPPLEARYKVLLKRIKKANRILDVGCGDGYLMSLVSRLCESVVGIDSEPTATSLAAAKLQRFRNSRVVAGSCYELPFVGGSFDVVLLADVIEHLADPERCLQEISRVLTPNGALLITTPKWRPDRRWDWRHFKEYKPEELAVCLKRCFSRVTMSFFWPMTWYRMYSTRVGWRLIRIFARYLYNPFLQEGDAPESFGQIVSVCESPCR
jgi:2-polyprenyl-3-methyl-5-hydroxy-6-metoxy-1,4-benzoquinol methylase